MRELNVDIITQNIKEMCIEANHFLTDDMKKVFNNAVATEESPLGKKVLNQLNENLDIAGNDMIPICQDTGMAVIFINVGQEVHFTNGNITDAINEGVRQGYVDGYLRKSVVSDPIIRENTKDNTPAVIHYNIVQGDKVDITVLADQTKKVLTTIRCEHAEKCERIYGRIQEGRTNETTVVQSSV